MKQKMEMGWNFLFMVLFLDIFQMIRSETILRQKTYSFNLLENCAVSNSQKVDCGYVGITIQECESSGCCWAQPPTGVVAPWCYYAGTNVPTFAPTKAPTDIPTIAPSNVPTIRPSQLPTVFPTVIPSALPTLSPTTAHPSTSIPTTSPTISPPTILPTTIQPTMLSTSIKPTLVTTSISSQKPTISAAVVDTNASPSTSSTNKLNLILTIVIVIGLVALLAISYLIYAYFYVYGSGSHFLRREGQRPDKPLPPVQVDELRGNTYVSIYSDVDTFKQNRRDFLHHEPVVQGNDLEIGQQPALWYDGKSHIFSN